MLLVFSNAYDEYQDSEYVYAIRVHSYVGGCVVLYHPKKNHAHAGDDYHAHAYSYVLSLYEYVNTYAVLLSESKHHTSLVLQLTKMLPQASHVLKRVKFQRQKTAPTKNKHLFVPCQDDGVKEEIIQD